jgi:hypothetical protein
MSPDRLDVDGVLGPAGLIERTLPGDEARPQQRAMAWNGRASLFRRGGLAQIAKKRRPGRGDGLLRFVRGPSGGSEAVACAAEPVLVKAAAPARARRFGRVEGAGRKFWRSFGTAAR